MTHAEVLEGLAQDITRTINRHVRDHQATPADIIAVCELVKAVAIDQLRGTHVPEPPQSGER